MNLVISYLCFWDWTWNLHYGICLYIEYVTLSRLIILYSRCRVNRGTNLSIVLCYVIFLCHFLLLLPLRVWASVWRSQLVGCVPTIVKHIMGKNN